MSEPTPHIWHLQVGATGQACQVLCNGEPLANVVSADLHMAADEPSTLRLKLGRYGPPQTAPTPRVHPGDPVTATGIPRWVIFEFDGRRFRVIEECPEEDSGDGLFGEKRVDGIRQPWR
jgi:hypothetical protein